MNCRKCNTQIEDGAAFCTQCGEKTDAVQADSAPAPQQGPIITKRKPRRAKMILIIAACVAVAACAVLIPVLIEKANAEKYEAAFAMMQGGDAPEAKKEFAELGGYNRDAQGLADTCQNMIEYKEAKALMGKGDYAGAKRVFDSLGGYEDSYSLSGDCQNTIDYNAAAELMDGGEAEKARDAFLALGDYSDSSTLAAECQKSLDYDAAKALMEAGDFVSAQSAFSNVLDYKDARSLMGVCYDEQQYVKAGEAFGKGQYYTAYEIYFELGDFKDSTDQAVKCIQPKPKNGQIYRNPDFKSKTCPLTIKTPKDGKFTFVKVYTTSGKLVSTVFIASGKNVKIKLPKGTYRFKTAAGEKWFGTEDIFGDEGYYTLVMFGADKDTWKLKKYYIYTLTLRVTKGGNEGLPQDRDGF